MLFDLLAATGLAFCIALAVHMALPHRARARVDDQLRRLGALWHALMERLTGWRRRQRQTRAAALEADRIIRKARESSLNGSTEGEWDGNVYRPKSFEKPRKPH